MKFRVFTLCAAFGALATFVHLAVPHDASAIAAFSRQYKTECSTCHTPYPHRNEFGEAFRKNGYVWPGRPPQEKPEGVEAFWLSGMLENVPLSVSFQQDVLYNPDADTDEIDPNTDLFLHLGGAIRDRVGYFAHDLTSSSAEAFGMFRRAFGSPINVKLGRLTPQTTLWKENQQFTEALLATYAYSVPGGGDALVKPRDALEVNAVLGTRLFAAVGVADRDNQDRMEFYGHLAYKFSGTDFLGGEPEMDFEEESVWDFLTVTIGGYAYLGNIKQPNDTDFYRLGLDVEAQYKGWTALASYGYGEDTDVDAGGTDVDSAVFLTEVSYFFAPSYQVCARYEYEDVGNAPDGVKHRGIAGFTYIPIENVLLRLEGKYVDNEDTENNKTALFQFIFHI